MKVKAIGISLLVVAAAVRAAQAVVIENDRLKVDFETTHGAFSVLDKRSGRVWTQLADSNAVSVTSASARGRAILFEATAKGVAGSLHGQVALDGDVVRTELDAPAEATFARGFESLVGWPCGFAGETGDRFLLPHGSGFSFPAEQTDMGENFDWFMSGYSREWRMGMWGQYTEQVVADGEILPREGFMAVVETPCNTVGTYLKRANGRMGFNLLWEGDLGTWGHLRRVRFEFMSEAGPMQMALRYREEMKKKGYYKTFAQKAGERPDMAENFRKIAGAPSVWYWAVDGKKAEVCRALREACGFGDFLFQFATRKDLGTWVTKEEVRACAEAAPGVLLSEYDMYMDTMDSKYIPRIAYIRPYWSTEAADKGDIIRNFDGSIRRGWKVAFKGDADGAAKGIGCATICEKKICEYVRKRLRSELKEKPWYNTRYLDGMGCIRPFECYDPNHRMSRRECVGLRREMMSIPGNEFRLITSTEDGPDYLACVCDYFTCGFSGANDYRVDGGRWMWKIYDGDPPDSIRRGTDEKTRMPIFEMVYHACSVAYWDWCDYNNKFPKIWWKRDLFNALCGTPPLYFFNEETWPRFKPFLKASYDLATSTARVTARAPMTAYRILTPDRTVQRAEFENGVTSTVNFGERDFVMKDGYVLKAHGHRLELPPSEPKPFDASVFVDRTERIATSCESRGKDRFALRLAGGGEAVFSRKVFDWGTRYTLESLDVPGATAFRFGVVRVPWATQTGAFANAIVGKDRAVCVRAYDTQTEMSAKGNVLFLENTASRGLVGTRFAIVEGALEGFRERLQAMTRDFASVTGVPLSANGGAFSQVSPDVRGSYFMVKPRIDQMDEAIDLAQRAGASILHIKNWWQSIGHYEPNAKLFPRGEADFRLAAEKIRAAGLLPGLHSLCVAVGVDDPWVRDGHASEFMPFAGYTYTLAKPLGRADTELIVNEPIKEGHDRSLTYLGRGNVLRIGGELVQYADFDRERRAFTGLVRGAFGTPCAAHAAGAKTDYLEQHFFEFFPRLDSPLVNDVVRALTDRYRAGGFGQFYFDGVEIFDGPTYGNPMRRAIYRGLAAVRAPIIEASGYGAHNWWWHSRTGTWDTPIWNLKRYHDMHLADLAATRAADFLEVGTGWFYPKASTGLARGFYRDEVEYFAAKNAGRDSPCSAGVSGAFRGRAIPVSSTDSFTLIGWYERLRRTRAFAKGIPEKLNAGTDEWRLRQNGAGVWTVRPVTPLSLKGGEKKSLQLAGGEDLALRVRPNWGVEMTSARTFIKEVGFVSTECPFKRTIPFPHGSVLPKDVEADSIAGRPVWRFRVKGDGQGGELRLRLETPREYGGAAAEHYVKVDFTGWRTFVSFDRERDARGSDPRQRYILYRNAIDPAHISSVSFTLVGGMSRSVEIGALEALTARAEARSDLAMEVNGRRITVPFALAGDEYAELESGLWRKYDGQGLTIGEAAGEKLVASAGANDFALIGAGTAHVQALGAEEPAIASDLAPEQRAALAREYDLTRVWNPAAGVTHLEPVVIRPGERARLQVRFVGLKGPATLTVGGQTLVEGLNEPLFTGSNPITFVCDSSTPVRIELAKIYDPM